MISLVKCVIEEGFRRYQEIRGLSSFNVQKCMGL